MFSNEDRATLAEWGAKTAAALIFAESGLEDLVPADDRFSLRRSGVPSSHAWIGFAAWDGPTTLHVGELTSLADPVNPTPYAYNVVLAIRGVALKVVSVYRKPSEEGADVVRGLIEQFWPVRSSLPSSWPPLIAFTDIYVLILFFP